MGYGVAMQTRAYRHLTAEERETVSLGLAQGHSLRAMARSLGRAPSTLSRELARNRAPHHPYRACTAQAQAATRAQQPRRRRKLLDPWLWQYVRTHLGHGCSPEQIAGRLIREYPEDMPKHCSPETIYAGLYVLPRGGLTKRAVGGIASGAQGPSPTGARSRPPRPDSQHDPDHRPAS